jgi:hypothetical protein
MSELSNTMVGVGRTNGLAKVPIRREAARDRFDVTGIERGVVAAHDITQVGVAGLEYRSPDLTPPGDGYGTQLGPEHDRPIVRGLDDDRHGPAHIDLALQRANGLAIGLTVTGPGQLETVQRRSRSEVSTPSRPRGTCWSVRRSPPLSRHMRLELG